ncbi:hypothetical protein P8452_10815 [Trifolium repens]|jgi:hypothetical protein|nr:hypothetical protein QL285_054549 [Trifolium repens]WJX21370.1 hypothetical protein P8452_10815 [Trifolium repens]
MAKKRLHIFHKVSNLLRISVLIHKLRKPIIPKLLLFKRLTKHKEFKLLIKNYNYGSSTIGEYQFPPSNTPLIHCHGNRFKNKGHIDLCSFFYLYWCLGNFKVEGSDNGGIKECQLEALQMAVIENEDFSVTDNLLDSEVEGESVDEKAEKFIQKFYQEMRMQRQESM